MAVRVPADRLLISIANPLPASVGDIVRVERGSQCIKLLAAFAARFQFIDGQTLAEGTTEHRPLTETVFDKTNAGKSRESIAIQASS